MASTNNRLTVKDKEFIEWAQSNYAHCYEHHYKSGGKLWIVFKHKTVIKNPSIFDFVFSHFSDIENAREWLSKEYA